MQISFHLAGADLLEVSPELWSPNSLESSSPNPEAAPSLAPVPRHDGFKNTFFTTVLEPPEPGPASPSLHSQASWSGPSGLSSLGLSFFIRAMGLRAAPVMSKREQTPAGAQGVLAPRLLKAMALPQGTPGSSVKGWGQTQPLSSQPGTLSTLQVLPGP